MTEQVKSHKYLRAKCQMKVIKNGELLRLYSFSKACSLETRGFFTEVSVNVPNSQQPPTSDLENVTNLCCIHVPDLLTQEQYKKGVKDYNIFDKSIIQCSPL